jgi:site-specific DNA-methyltransferase (adenine-specific)
MREYLNITNECNLELMKRYKDNHFDLAIVDPPYGIDVITKGSFGNPQKKDGTITHGIDKRNGRKIIRKKSKYKLKDWDSKTPDELYFKELFRVSKNQIIFGANHFISKMPFDSSSWIVWNKVNGTSRQADCELAWTSFNTAVRMFTFKWYGMLQGSRANGSIMEGNISKHEKRIHPTQKPSYLYEMIIKKYANEGDKILDTHLGSGSIAIAVDTINKIEKMKLTLTACEIDKDYFNETVKRLETDTKWNSLF